MAFTTVSRVLTLSLHAYSVAAFGPYSGWDPQGEDSDDSGSFEGSGGFDDSGSQSSDGFSTSSSQFGFAGFDIERASYLRTVHGVLASVAFIAVFPLGAVLMRLVPGRMAIICHALTQVTALSLFVAAVGLGAYIVNLVQEGGFPLLEDDMVVAHVGIGSAVAVVFLLMPVMGYMHHRNFKKVGRRGGWSYLHLAGGRLGITLGIINGGLGLSVSGARNRYKVAYGIAAGVVWVIWMTVAAISEVRRGRGTKKVESTSRSRSGLRKGRRGRHGRDASRGMP